MANLFKISGYWKETKKEFSDRLVYANDDQPEWLNIDGIFDVGMNENRIKEAITNPDSLTFDETAVPYVITSYEEA